MLFLAAIWQSNRRIYMGNEMNRKIEYAWWRLFQKRVVPTKFDSYVLLLYQKNRSEAVHIMNLNDVETRYVTGRQ